MDLRTSGGGRVSWDEVSGMDLYTLPNVKQIASGKQLHSTGRSAQCFCDHLEGWDREGGRETQEGGDMGIYVYV